MQAYRVRRRPIPMGYNLPEFFYQNQTMPAACF